MENCATTLKMNSEQVSERRAREMVMELLSLIHAWHGGSLCLSDSINPALPILSGAMSIVTSGDLTRYSNNAHRDNRRLLKIESQNSRACEICVFTAAGDFNARAHLNVCKDSVP